MKKQIFRSICLATITVFLAAVTLIMGVLYDYFSSVQMKGLENETVIAASAVEVGGENYLKEIANGDYRITWIDSKGTVLFDNKANSSEMENLNVRKLKKLWLREQDKAKDIQQHSLHSSYIVQENFRTDQCLDFHQHI